MRNVWLATGDEIRRLHDNRSVMGAVAFLCQLVSVVRWLTSSKSEPNSGRHCGEGLWRSGYFTDQRPDVPTQLTLLPVFR